MFACLITESNNGIFIMFDNSVNWKFSRDNGKVNGRETLQQHETNDEEIQQVNIIIKGKLNAILVVILFSKGYLL